MAAGRADRPAGPYSLFPIPDSPLRVAGMKDWKNHQKLMQANKDHQAGTPSQAQSAWLKQYHAAPKNINAFKKATAKFKAPDC